MFVSDLTTSQSIAALKDRKCLKSLSDGAALAMTAIENLAKNIVEKKNAKTFGLFVSAPAPYTRDKENYREAAIAATRVEAIDSLFTFGSNAQLSAPTTGLIGLPNGILSFGAKALGARGPNSCYISEETGVHLALASIRRHINLRRLEFAVIVSYAKPSQNFYQPGNLKLHDEGFAALISREHLQSLSSPTYQILEIAFAPRSVYKARVELLLSCQSLTPSDIDLVTVHGSPISQVGEICAQLKLKFPVVRNINSEFGYGGETFGLREIVFASAKRYGLIISVTSCQQMSFLLYKTEI